MHSVFLKTIWFTVQYYFLYDALKFKLGGIVSNCVNSYDY